MNLAAQALSARLRFPGDEHLGCFRRGIVPQQSRQSNVRGWVLADPSCYFRQRQAVVLQLGWGNSPLLESFFPFCEPWVASRVLLCHALLQGYVNGSTLTARLACCQPEEANRPSSSGRLLLGIFPMTVRFCPQCGAKTAPQANFCAGCGEALPGTTGNFAKQTQTASAPSRSML